MKRLLLICAGLLTIPAWVAQTSYSQENFEWARLHKLLKSYITRPSSENAKAVAEILPYPNHVHYTKSSDQDSALETLDYVFAPLRRQMLLADTQAVRLAFRLFSVTDGYLSESLDELLGALITRNPALFLEQLQSHKQLFGEDFEGIGRLVGNLGEGYVDNLRAKAAQVEKRLSKLLHVQHPDLKHVRDKCVSYLNDYLARLTAIMNSLEPKFHQVEVGMTTRAVRLLLGKPVQTEMGYPRMIYSNGEVELFKDATRSSWFYCESDSSSGVNTIYIVVFAANSDTVIEKDRDQTLRTLIFK